MKHRPHIVAKLAAEFLACSMFHFIGSMSPTPWANGLALMTSVYYSAKISGAHLNPALSIVFCLLGFTLPLEAVLYAAAQVGGCILGALLVAMVTPNSTVGGPPPPGTTLGCFLPKEGLTEAHVFALETVGTIMFIVPVMSVVWYTQNKNGYGNTGPIMVGISLIASALAIGSWTGAAFNPARTLGSAFVFDCAKNSITGAYIAGQVLAALLSPLFIVPWYGISNRAWYASYVPERVKLALRIYLPSIEFKTLDKEDPPQDAAGESGGARAVINSHAP